MTSEQDDFETETLSGDVRSAIMDRIRALDLTWAMMPESHQRALTGEIDALARHLVKEAVNLVAADGQPVIRARLGAVTRKNQEVIEGKITLLGTDEQRHELFDAVDTPVMIVVADTARYIGERAPEPIDPDQPSMIDDAA